MIALLFKSFDTFILCPHMITLLFKSFDTCIHHKCHFSKKKNDINEYLIPLTKKMPLSLPKIV